MATNRVVSLAPSATEICRGLDAADRLVGVTHHCPLDVPAVGGWLNPDFDAVEERDPDLVLTTDSLQADVRDDLRDRGLRVVHVEPETLPEVVESFATVGRAIGKPDDGRRPRVDALEAESNAFADRSRDDRRPVVYCEEWSAPPTAAGNWVPDAVRAAGGEYPFLAAGERSREVDAETVEDAEPDTSSSTSAAGASEATRPPSSVATGTFPPSEPVPFTSSMTPC